MKKMSKKNALKKSVGTKKNLNYFEVEKEKKGLTTEEVMGYKICSNPYDQVLKSFQEILTKKASDGHKFVVTLNPEILLMAEQDPEYKHIINRANMILADGRGLRFLSPKINKFTPGRKLVLDLVANKKIKVFYLGGRNGVAWEMAQKFGGMSDGGSADIKTDLLNHVGFSDREFSLIHKINQFAPDLLLVAYGAPWQEKWIYKTLQRLNVKMAIGVGGTFDYLTGRKAMPPVVVEKMGLEWLWRLVHEPWRWKRQIKLVKFIGMAVRRRLAL